jgi:hypothetical protein
MSYFFAMLSVVMLDVIILTVIMVGAIMLSVVASLKDLMSGSKTQITRRDMLIKSLDDEICFDKSSKWQQVLATHL